MSGIATAVVGGSLITGLVQDRAASKAAEAQIGASDAAIAEQQRQFESVQELLRPYVESGTEGIEAQKALIGLRGRDPQQEAISALEASPAFTSLVQQGENALLQNAAATGGLRGGNLQGALAQYRPQILSQLIESQFSKLGQLGGLGQASAAGQAAAGQQTSGNIANLLAQQGQAQAGAELARGQAIGQFGSSLGQLALLKGLGAF